MRMLNRFRLIYLHAKNLITETEYMFTSMYLIKNALHHQHCYKLKYICCAQTFVTVASFVQWRLQHGTYFPDKTQSTEFLRWYLMIVSIYKLQYIWICCQFLSQLLKLIFNVIKTGLISPPSPWELIQSCR